MESAPRSIGPLGANGNQRRRVLLHHLPLAIASVGFLVLFTKLPLFDVNAYEHGDVMTGAFPQPRAAAAMTEADAQGHAHSGRAAHAGRADHGSEHETTMGHGVTSVQPNHGRWLTAMAEWERATTAADRTHGDGQQNVALSRSVQQLTVATGYVGVGLLALTLLLGPANLLLGRRNPVSTYLRRDVGIWTAIFSVAHVILAVAIHVSHGSSVVARHLLTVTS